MMSHPHDCPVCDEGGECHLQDMTVMTGHVYRRYRFDKRTFRNQDLGPFVTHEMNRCIQCYRCLRFYEDYAGGHDFGAFGLRNHVYFGRAEDGPLESEFSGNLVEVCPIGVFDDKTLRRPLHAQVGPADGARRLRALRARLHTIPGERYGELRRIRNRFNAEVNGYFLCDRGRYGYEFVNTRRSRLRAARLRGPSRRLGAKTTPSSTAWRKVLDERRAASSASARRAPRWKRTTPCARSSAPDNFYLGVADDERELLDQCRSSSCATALRATPALPRAGGGRRLRHRAGRGPHQHRADARLRAAPLAAPAADRRKRCGCTSRAGTTPAWAMVKAHEPSALWSRDDARDQARRAGGADGLSRAPADLARLGFAVAARLARRALAGRADPGPASRLASRRPRPRLAGAQHPHIVSGPSCASADLLRAAAALSAATPQPAMLTLTCREVNSMGARACWEAAGSRRPSRPPPAARSRRPSCSRTTSIAARRPRRSTTSSPAPASRSSSITWPPGR